MRYTVGWAATRGDQILVRTVSHTRIAAMLNFLVLEVDQAYQRYSGYDNQIEAEYAKATRSRPSRILRVSVEEMRLDE